METDNIVNLWQFTNGFGSVLTCKFHEESAEADLIGFTIDGREKYHRGQFLFELDSIPKGIEVELLVGVKIWEDSNGRRKVLNFTWWKVEHLRKGESDAILYRSNHLSAFRKYISVEIRDLHRSIDTGEATRSEEFKGIDPPVAHRRINVVTQVTESGESEN